MSVLLDRLEALGLVEDFKEVDHIEIYLKSERNYFELSRFFLQEEENNSISLKVLFEALEIEPQELRSIFHRKSIQVPHSFPHNLSWFGLNKETHYIIEVEIPEEISTYDELGYFEYSDKEAFKALSKILEKKIDVYKIMGTVYVYEFKVYPDGRIAEIIHI